jgi:HEAT repeat protein
LVEGNDNGNLAPEVINEMMNLAQTADPLARAKLFDAFDGVRDPALLPSLVQGLQDTNPNVRESAADALSSYSGDPRVQEWLKHVVQNDSDPRVQREAQEVLEESQRRR